MSCQWDGRGVGVVGAHWGVVPVGWEGDAVGVVGIVTGWGGDFTI